MAGKASILRAPGGQKDLGKFHTCGFNFFIPEDVTAYEKLRTENNDHSSGVVIENVREFTRKVTVREGEGADQVVTTSEDLYIIVQWWKKEPKPPKGESDDESKSEPAREWSEERHAVVPEAQQ